ncbi:PAS domain S-box protein [Neobacillus piezotolerans]|uniref:PAS domain S-box protein n=1 Tax=Neobacillus piezotolerans TaxID=2259171 RepID=A0A3D8GVW7_9BACI|nr:GGDEF domain-containing phosphodiesterase [Neobacillus piezotolerans]RDU38176.1 PAS domain S-box protein [Neobacillus piezotolerans]
MSMLKTLFKPEKKITCKSTRTVMGRPMDTTGGFMDTANNAKDNETILKIEKSLDMAHEVANIASWDYETDRDYVFGSEALFSILGMNQHKMIDTTYPNMLEMVLEDDRNVFDYHFQNTKKTGKRMELKFRVKRADGTMITVQLRAEAIKDENGKVSRIFGVLRDISNDLLKETKLKESEEKLEKIASSLDVGIWSYDFELERMVYVSHGVEAITGERNELLLLGERKWKDYIHHEDLEKYQSNYSKLRQAKTIIHQYRIIDVYGIEKWIEDRVFPISNSRGELIRLDGIVQDISERKLLEEKMNYYAFHDNLTDLPNRRKLIEVLTGMVSCHNKFSLLYIDLDMFKNVNDRLGSRIGDQLLQELTKRLTAKYTNLGEFYRIGGDKFALILRQMTEPSRLNLIGREIIDSIRQVFYIEGFEIHITASIGMSIHPTDGQTVEDLELNTEVALRRAKELGKNRLQLYTESLSIETFKLFSLESDLRKAILLEDFILHYQPRVNTLTGDVVAAEALIRWNHPLFGLISPAEFIPIAEESNLIDQISFWVIEQVCKVQRQLIQSGDNIVPVSVNLSAKTIMRADLIPTILNYLERYGIEPNLLEIEITENTMIKAEMAAISAIEKLKEIGIAISLDDFGTGYSSISYLKKFKVNYIKIDRSFITSMLVSQEDARIVESIHLLAKGFNLKVVAEGVETTEQLKRLKQLNCHYIQGYLFSKPIDEEQFLKIISNNSRLLYA